MTARLRCVVPHCRRSISRARLEAAMGVVAPAKASEWLCGDHWRMLPKQRRRVYGRHVRRWRRFSPLGASWSVAADRIWQRLKHQAIERAVGI